jgi:hypothetical protein
MLKDAHKHLRVGLPDTAVSQASSFVESLQKLVTSSAVVREFIVEIVANCKENPIILYFGR